MAHYDLEERTLVFAKEIRKFVKSQKLNLIIENDLKQLIRSSGSVGANYIEANESFSKKDFVFRAKIARKEAKESRFWLACLEGNILKEFESDRKKLHTEATEIMKIFGAIIRNSENPSQ